MNTKDRLKQYLSLKNIGRNKFEQQIGVSTGYLSTKSLTISSDVIEKTAEIFPELNINWLLTGNGMMTKSDDNNENQIKIETKPRIPYTAAAGLLSEGVEGLMKYQCEHVPVIPTFPKYDFTIVVKGDSMQPHILGGDEIACKRIDETSFIQWGKVHVLDTSQGIVVKRIYEDGDKIKCVSYNPEYPPFSIDKKDIYSYNLVVGLLRI